MTISYLVATVGKVGELRPAPGTWGSLAALPLAWLLMISAPLWVFFAAIVAVTFTGYIATHQLTKNSDDHDPSYIVIDEVAGQWVALLPVAIGSALTGAAPTALWPGWCAAFVLFRLFDITKPSLIGKADQRGDAFGVMLDDLIAGFFAAIGVAILAAVGHGVMLFL